ncbi:MAG: hypothetical protein GQ559_03355 [Desulfobulbaceae bacterium]|nr:hypothetical protein [Desulfobulbaceae bacterium]
MALRKKKRPVKRKTAKKFRFQLSLAGIAGIGIVFFCLFFWMFILGIWAGQTILLPSTDGNYLGVKTDDRRQSPPPVEIIVPTGKKKPVSRTAGS